MLQQRLGTLRVDHRSNDLRAQLARPRALLNTKIMLLGPCSGAGIGGTRPHDAKDTPIDTNTVICGIEWDWEVRRRRGIAGQAAGAPPQNGLIQQELARSGLSRLSHADAVPSTCWLRARFRRRTPSMIYPLGVGAARPPGNRAGTGSLPDERRESCSVAKLGDGSASRTGVHLGVHRPRTVEHSS